MKGNNSATNFYPLTKFLYVSTIDSNKNFVKGNKIGHRILFKNFFILRGSNPWPIERKVRRCHYTTGEDLTFVENDLLLFC